MKYILIASILVLSISLETGCSKTTPTSTETTPPTNAQRLPTDQQVQVAVNNLVTGIRRGGGTVSVKGVRATPDGGAEADLIFQQFNYEVSSTLGPHEFSGEGIATIARYSDGLYLTRVTFNYGDYVTGKIRL